MRPLVIVVDALGLELVVRALRRSASTSSEIVCRRSNVRG